MTTDHAQHSIRLDIQGLRAVAVLAVLVFHVNSAWLAAGFVGVDVFFVISGFIITTLLTERGIKTNLVAFYSSRIKRILPAYFFMLIVVCMVSAIIFLPHDYTFFQRSLESSTLFISNHYFSGLGSYFAPSSDEMPLLHTWSLAIEMQFYLFFPLLVACLPASWRLMTFTLMTLSLFAWSGYQVMEENQGALYFSLFARIPEFMAGAVIAVAMRDREVPVVLSAVTGILGATLLGVAFLVIDKQQFPGFWSILPCLGAGLIIVSRRGPISTLLATRPMVWLGGLSYSLYLWHWPVLAFIRYYTGQYELAVGWLLVFICVSTLFAWASLRFVEQPARSAKVGGRQVVKWVLAATGVVFVAWLSRGFNASLVPPLPVELTRYAAPDLICHGKLVGECKRGKLDAPVSVLVIGDSHAAQLNYFFEQAGAESGVAYRVLTASSCVPIPGFDVDRLPAWAQKSCRAQMDAVSEALSHMNKIIIAGMWQYQMQSAEFAQALSDFVREATNAHKQVVILAQVPMFDSDVQRVRRFTEIGLPAVLYFNHEWENANSQVELIVKRTPGVQFLDFSNSSFFAAAPYHEGSLIYRDRHHLNELGARRYGQYAGAQLQRAFDQSQSSVSFQP